MTSKKLTLCIEIKKFQRRKKEEFQNFRHYYTNNNPLKHSSIIPQYIRNSLLKIIPQNSPQKYHKIPKKGLSLMVKKNNVKCHNTQQKSLKNITEKMKMPLKIPHKYH